MKRRVIIESPYKGSAQKAFLAYEIRNRITGARYIGITCRPLRRRWNDHCTANNNGAISRAIRKYGRGAFTMRVIAEAKSYDALLDLERILIAQEGTRNHLGGYNLTDGGEGTLGREPSQATRKALSDSSRMAMQDPARRTHLSECAIRQMADPKNRQIISAANKGRKHTDETRRKVSEAVRRRPPRSKETCEKLAAALRGKKRPPEVRAKIAAAKMGKPMSETARRNMSLASKGRPKSDAMRAKLRAYHQRRREARAP